MPAEFIWDGYSEDGYMAADANGQYGEHRFQYRPATVQERAPIRDALNVKTSEYNRLTAELCAKLLINWDVIDPRTKKVAKIEAENILCLTHALFARMTDIIMGWQSSDKDPKSSKPHDGMTGAEREAADEKN